MEERGGEEGAKEEPSMALIKRLTLGLACTARTRHSEVPTDSR